MPSGPFYLKSLDKSFINRRGVVSYIYIYIYILLLLLLLLLPCFIEIPVYNANSVDPDQTRRSAAFDQGLHCLSMSLLWDARLKRVKYCLGSIIKEGNANRSFTMGQNRQ